MSEHVYESNPVDSAGYVNWSEIENQTWSELSERQVDLVKNVACDEFLEGLEILGFPKESVPQIPNINNKLADITGWGVEPVPAIIQPKEFFTLLTKKRFPAATFIRIPEQKDYIKEPDIFHEVYGHTPLLTNQAYADFMEKFGHLALEANPKDRRRLFRLFWFTIEFGLIKTENGLRAYGGGILSSPGETKYCLTDESIKKPFDALTCLRTPYRIDIMQPLYFVIEKFDDLFTILDQDILALIEKAKELGDFPPAYETEDVKFDEEKGPMKC